MKARRRSCAGRGSKQRCELRTRLCACVLLFLVQLSCTSCQNERSMLKHKQRGRAQEACSRLMHTPLGVAHMPSSVHLAAGAGEGVLPSAQVAVQFVPTGVLSPQLKVAWSKEVFGLPAQPAAERGGFPVQGDCLVHALEQLFNFFARVSHMLPMYDTSIAILGAVQAC